MAGGQVPGAGSQHALRARNVDAVVAALNVHRDLSQADLARLTGLSPGSVSSIIRDLERAGRVVISTRARRKQINMCAPPGAVVGIDIGRSHLRMILGDMSGEALAETLTPLAPGTPVDDVVAEAVRQLEQAVAAHPGLDVMGACIGVAGPVSPSTGRVVAPALLPEWFKVDIRPVFEQALAVPVVVENDANLGALAEARSNPPDEDLVYIKVGTGIGAGIVLHGQVWRGTSNVAGELGHISIDPNGIVCRCGNRGCLETVASVPAIMGALGIRELPLTTIDDVVSLALGGDLGCARVLGDAGASIGAIAAIACTVVNPGHIVIGGPITGAGELVLGPLRDSMRRSMVPVAGLEARVTASVYGDRASAVGAVTRARDIFTPTP